MQASAMPPYAQFLGPDSTNSVAANRAAQQLQAQYGVRAAGSINAIQDRMGQQQQPNLGQGQTDGAAEEDADYYEGVLMERSEAGTLHELGRVDIDRILHSKIAANSKSMEGGGLMLPLKEATSGSAAGPSSRKGKGVAAFDGGDDDEEDDEDAINSDLDDPEDEDDGDEPDDEGLGHIMLCTYDKVQRVKNKWFVLLGIEFGEFEHNAN